MTENKRFQYNVNKNSIEYDGKHFAYCNGEQNKIANKLNGLAEENKELKEFKQQVITLIDNNIEKLNNTDTVSLIPRESIMVLERLKKVIDDDRE